MFSNPDFPLICRCGKTVQLSNPQYVRKAHYAVKRMSKSRINLLIFCFVKSITKFKKNIKLSFRFVAAFSTALLEFFFYELSNLVTQTHAMSKVYRVTDPETDNVQSFFYFSIWLIWHQHSLWLCRSIRKHAYYMLTSMLVSCIILYNTVHITQVNTGEHESIRRDNMFTTLPILQLH